MSNIEKIQKMAKGIYNRSVQIGYEGKSVDERKEGETWVDHNNRTWVKENGKRKQITKIPPRGFDKCSDCEKLILKTLDQQTYDRFRKCRVCQMEFEANLHREGEWNEWVTKMEEKRWEAFLSDYEEEMKLLEKNKTLRFDKTVANALANNEMKK